MAHMKVGYIYIYKIVYKCKTGDTGGIVVITIAMKKQREPMKCMQPM